MKQSKQTRNEHYVDNAAFTQAVAEYVKCAKSAKDKNKEIPCIPEYIGEAFLKIAIRLSSKGSFFNYTYRDEMVADAVENCVKAIHNYDLSAKTRSGNPNAFGYFTQIIYWAFLRRIAKEKKHQDIKESYMATASIDSFMITDGNDVNNSSTIERIRARYEEN